MKRRSARKNAKRRIAKNWVQAYAVVRKPYTGPYPIITPMHLDEGEQLFIVTDVQPDYVACVQEMFWGNLELSTYFGDGEVTTVIAWHDLVYYPVEELVALF